MKVFQKRQVMPAHQSCCTNSGVYLEEMSNTRTNGHSPWHRQTLNQ